MRLLPLLGIAGLSAALLWLTGCASTPSAGSLEQALEHYDAGRYEQSYDLAAREAHLTRGQSRSRAAYLAGLSAHRLGRLDAAERHLTVAAANAVGTERARVVASLGLVRLDQQRPADAAALFAEAAGGLEGDDARRAARHAAHGYREAGQLDEVRRWSARAGTEVAVNDGTASFALQAGAFSSRARAQRCASNVRPIASRHGLETVLVSRRDAAAGRLMYLVRLGQFPSRTAAVEMRDRLGRPEYIVVTSGDSRF